MDPHAEPELLVDARDGVLRVTLNRPQKRNAINEIILDGLTTEVKRFAEDPEVRLFLLRSNGTYFSAGGDLHSPLFPDLSHQSPARFRAWLRSSSTSLSPLINLIAGIEKPMVVAHQGPCLGGGLELSLAFDFRLAASSASYRMPEPLLGAMPSAGGTARLTRLIGPHWARWLLLAVQSVSAEEARSMGLVHAVYPDESFAEQVEAFCRALCAIPPEVMAATKSAIEIAADLGDAGGRAVERLVASSLVFGREYQEELAKFQSRTKR